MAQNDKFTKALSKLTCAFGGNDDEHICEDPLFLSCGHCICRKCKKPGVSYTAITCGKADCNKINNRDLEEEYDTDLFECVFDANLNKVFDLVANKFKSTVKTCKDTLGNSSETILNHVETIKQMILIRIESLKIDLDNLMEYFNKELDQIKEEWISESTNTVSDFTVENCDELLKKLEEVISKQDEKTRENLFYFQNQQRNIKTILEKLSENSPSLEFKESNEKLDDPEIVGKLIFKKNNANEVHKALADKVRKYQNKEITIKDGAMDILFLSNGNMIAANFSDDTLQIYDKNFKLTRTIDQIGNKKCGIVCIATSENEKYFYLSDYANQMIIKTDDKFKKLASFGNGAGSGTDKVYNPIGICYNKNYVYVCDSVNDRIVKLNADLKYETSFKLKYMPWHIKNINMVAMVRGLTDTSIYFHKLDNFDVIRKFDGHNGLIGVLDACFYEYYVKNTTLYCYSKSGRLIEEINVDIKQLGTLNCAGTIASYDSKLYLKVFEQNVLMAF